MTRKPPKDEDYFELVASALRVCAAYKPRFGKGRKIGLSRDEFQQLYRADAFYNWVGLDSPLMYAAHKAAGGMTSLYRQLGIGVQRLFHHLLQDRLGLSAQQASWQYQVPVPGRQPRTLSLDGRIAIGDIASPAAKARLERWVEAACEKVLLAPETRQQVRGAVFEVRQGYKSKDSKRQNADISNASNAYAHSYVPVLFLLSTQIDGDVAIRYTQVRWLLLTGKLTGPATESTYAFCREVLDYDLAGFFERNSSAFRRELEKVLVVLLGAD